MSTAGYLQDDWRVNQKLIVNLGLRYEYVTPMKGANNSLGTFDSTLEWCNRVMGPRVSGQGITAPSGHASVLRMT